MFPTFAVADHQEGGPFEEQHFVGVNDVGKDVEMLFQFVHIGNQRVNDLRPRLVEGFVPDRGSKAGALQWLRQAFERVFALFEDLSANRIGHCTRNPSLLPLTTSR